MVTLYWRLHTHTDAHARTHTYVLLLLLLLSHFSRVRLCATPERRQPTRPWDSPGKNTGVGCHFLLQCMKVKSESEAAQSCSILCDPMDCSLPGSSVHGIFQARVLGVGCHCLLRWESYPSPILACLRKEQKFTQDQISQYFNPGNCPTSKGS